MTDDIRIQELTEERWPEVEAIYAAGIATGHATFEAAPPTWQAFDDGKLPGMRFVAVDANGRVLGWAAVSGTSERSVYAGVVEDSVYVASAARGCGVGRVLLRVLIDATEAAGIWTIQSGIFPENRASLHLHLALAFEVVGTRRRLGRMAYGPLAGSWRDVIMVERRSTAVGLD